MTIFDISKGKTIKKIKALQANIADYTAIKVIKKRYLNSLQHYKHYGSVNTECFRIQQEVKFLDAQLADMDGKLLLLKKELE